MADIKVGDRVRVVSEYEDSAGRHADKTGTVDRVDLNDRCLPYRVALDGEDADWVYSVERIGAGDRERHVTRAKELLADTVHTGDDVIRMARFLAGETVAGELR